MSEAIPLDHEIPFIGGPYQDATQLLPATALSEGRKVALESPTAPDDDVSLPDESWHVYELRCPEYRWQYEYRGVFDESTAPGLKKRLEHTLNN
jgi:hypothetical protein